MAKKSNNEIHEETIVDVVAVKGDLVRVTSMSYLKSKDLNKYGSWKVIVYQKGFHSFKEKK